MNGFANSTKPDLILASSSPRRKDLLQGLGVQFSSIPADVEESHLNGESPEEHVSRLALAKARKVAESRPGIWVLGADTIVVIDGRILGKPEDEAEAKAMLRTLAGRTHEVFTGYALINSAFAGKETVQYVRSSVFIRDLSEREIEDYVSTREPMDKAGAYAIQGIGSGIVQSVVGSYTNVVGLPLCEVARDMQHLGIFDFLRAAAKP